jgi:Flp pilus assembly protein TadG
MAMPNNPRRGSTMVEFGLIGVLFFALLIGIMDFGQFLFVQQAIVERTRTAARWGAVHDPTDTASIRNMLLYLQATAPSGQSPSFGLTPPMVTVSSPDPGTDNYRLVIQVSGYSFAAFSPYLAGSYKGSPITVSVPLGQYR